MVKSWPVSFGKQGESGNEPQFYIGIFECPKCKSRFRSRLESNEKPVEPVNVETLVDRIRDVREGLKQTLKTLRERMSALETERAGLMVEIRELKTDAESRANSLESEVSQLREEVKSLRELLDSVAQEPISPVRPESKTELNTVILLSGFLNHS